MFAAVLPLLVFASTVLATPLARQNAPQYWIYNKCPTPIDFYTGGVNRFKLRTEVKVKIREFPSPFYTTANGGSENGDKTIRAYFHEDYYYIVSDPNHANTGLRVKPKDRSQSNSFCQEIECDGRGCPQAFSTPPTTFPTPSSTVPAPPYYRCPIANTEYEITFCPTGQFADQGQPIHYNNLQNMCLGVRNGVLEDGMPVQVGDCNGSQAQRWIINRGITKLQVAGTNFCLDAGSSPGDGVQLRISTCKSGNPAQLWVYTVNNNHIMLANQGLCIDLENGNPTTGHVQARRCTNGNDHQVWKV